MDQNADEMETPIVKHSYEPSPEQGLDSVDLQGYLGDKALQEYQNGTPEVDLQQEINQTTPDGEAKERPSNQPRDGNSTEGFAHSTE